MDHYCLPSSAQATVPGRGMSAGTVRTVGVCVVVNTLVFCHGVLLTVAWLLAVRVPTASSTALRVGASHSASPVWIAKVLVALVRLVRLQCVRLVVMRLAKALVVVGHSTPCGAVESRAKLSLVARVAVTTACFVPNARRQFESVSMWEDLGTVGASVGGRVAKLVLLSAATGACLRAGVGGGGGVEGETRVPRWYVLR